MEENNKKQHKLRISFEWINDNRIIAALSLLLSIILWIIVSVNVTAETSKVISNVPITIDTTDLSENFGLDRIAIVDPPALSSGTVDVVLYGSIYQLSRVTPEDVSVTAQTGGVNRSGEFTLMLSVNCSNKNVRASISNNYTFIKVWFDRIMTTNIEVDKLSVSGVGVASDDLIIGDYYSSIKSLTVSGPESIIENLGSVQVRASLDKTISETSTVAGTLHFLNHEGVELEKQYSSYLSIIDYNGLAESTGTAAGAPIAEDITVTIPIRKAIVLPLKISLKNAPEGFDASKLKYSISRKNISIEGDVEAIDKLAGIGYYQLSSIDLSTLSASNSSFTIKLNLSSGIIEKDGLSEVTIMFDLDGYKRRTIKLSNRSSYSFTDVPEGVDVSLLTEQLEVTVFGPEDLVDELSAKDLKAVISLEGYDGTTGQKMVSAAVTLKESARCWVLGTYSVTVSFE